MLVQCTFSDGDYIEFDEKYLSHVKAYVTEAVSIMVREDAVRSIIETNKVVIDTIVEEVKIRDCMGNIKEPNLQLAEQIGKIPVKDPETPLFPGKSKEPSLPEEPGEPEEPEEPLSPEEPEEPLLPEEPEEPLPPEEPEEPLPPEEPEEPLPPEEPEEPLPPEEPEEPLPPEQPEGPLP